MPAHGWEKKVINPGPLGNMAEDDSLRAVLKELQKALRASAVVVGEFRTMQVP